MDEQITQNLIATTERLAAAAEALEKTLARLDAQHQALNSHIDRIVAAVEEGDAVSRQQLQEQVSALERENADLKGQAARLAANAARKTLPPLVSALLAKTGLDDPHGKIDAAILDKTLATLTVEQRIAVKAQMARAGLID